VKNKKYGLTEMYKSNIKNMLRSIKNNLIGYTRKLDEQILPVFSSTRLMCSIYYLLFNPSFRREQFAVLQGRRTYVMSTKHAKDSSALLRRNIHRLEKGIVMQPRRKVFGLKFIHETIDCYKKCIVNREICDDELKWAHSVIENYMDVVDLNNKTIHEAFNKFKSIDSSRISNETSFIPYESSRRAISTITDSELLNLFKQRRSTRWYEDKQVPYEKLVQAVNMASYAPSACNRQPFKFYIINDPTLARETAAIAMGTAGFSNNIQSLVVILGDLSYYPAERDRHVIYIDGSLAAMQLMLALEVLGLSTCPINWPDIEKLEKKLEKKLKLPTYLRPILLLSVGYAKSDGMIPYSQKKNAEVLIYK
jgi:nitroreductase